MSVDFRETSVLFIQLTAHFICIYFLLYSGASNLILDAIKAVE